MPAIFMPHSQVMFGAHNVINENWANTSAWTLNDYSISGTYTAKGSATVASNRFQADSYGDSSAGGPVLSIDIGGVDDFTLTGNLRMETLSGNAGGYVRIGLADSANPTDDYIDVGMGNSTSEPRAKLAVFNSEGGSFTTEVNEDSPSVADVYEIDFSLSRTGTTVSFSCTGDFEVSDAWTSTSNINSIYVQCARSSVSNIYPLSVGPLTFEY